MRCQRRLGSRKTAARTVNACRNGSEHKHQQESKSKERERRALRFPEQIEKAQVWKQRRCKQLGGKALRSRAPQASSAARRDAARASGETLQGSTARQTTDRGGGAGRCVRLSCGSRTCRSEARGCAARACAAMCGQRSAGHARGAPALSTRRACWCLQPKAAVAVHAPQLAAVSIASHVAWSGAIGLSCTAG